MWHIANYEPTSLFSLRPANATSSGGKTLLTPTPFAIKMALLDVAIRVYGVESGKKWFPQLRDLRVAIQLPQHLVVINTFIKILRPHKAGTKDTFGTGLEGPMGNTIAYRELVQFGGLIRLAVQSGDVKGELPLPKLLSQVHYLGKRGGFIQYAGFEGVDQLSEGFVRLNPPANSPFLAYGTMQLLDDCGPKMTFEHADVYSDKNLSVGKPNGRLLNSVVLPYRLAKSSRSYSLYQHTSS